LVFFADAVVLKRLNYDDGPGKGRHQSQNEQYQLCNQTATQYHPDYARFS